MDNLIEKLKIVRSNARLMHRSYLESSGLQKQIDDLVPGTFNNREKIDIIIKGTFDKCHCGNFSKPNSQWCSITCKNKDPVNRQNISTKNSSNSVERLEKARKTRLERYGVEAVQDIPLAKEKTRLAKQKYYNEVIDDTFIRYGLDRVKLSDHEYLKTICDGSGLFDVKEQYFGDMPVTTVVAHFNRIGFDPKFKKGATSSGEQEMFAWIKSVVNDVVLNNHRKTLGKELDIYIPSQNLAIEYHGLYWHSDQLLESKGVNPIIHHSQKMKLANDNNIRLLQFFEDEWLTKKNIVKSVILSKLGLYSQRVYARNTCVKVVPINDARLFLNENHLQGFAIGKHIGLYKDDELLAIMTVGRSRFDNTHELIRFASKLNTQVVGGFTKLLKHAKIMLGVDTLTTYADLRYSDGNTYKKNGIFVKNTAPGYFWVDRSKNLRINRFNTQKHKLPKLLGNKFDPALSEAKNMEYAGYIKIYDCGNAVYTI